MAKALPRLRNHDLTRVGAGDSPAQVLKPHPPKNGSKQGIKPRSKVVPPKPKQAQTPRPAGASRPSPPPGRSPFVAATRPGRQGNRNSIHRNPQAPQLPAARRCAQANRPLRLANPHQRERPQRIVGASQETQANQEASAALENRRHRPRNQESYRKTGIEGPRRARRIRGRVRGQEPAPSGEG